MIVWIVLGWVLTSATWLAAEWVKARSRQRMATSRHIAWATMVSELPPGSRLTGVEFDGRTRLEIGPAAQHPWESRGER